MSDKCLWDNSCDRAVTDLSYPWCEEHWQEAADLEQQGLIELRERKRPSNDNER